MKTGTPMQLICPRVRFMPQGQGAPAGSRLDDKIVEVRRLLRTDKSISEIARDLGVSTGGVSQFIKRRRLCDMQERHRAISAKKLEPLE